MYDLFTCEKVKIWLWSTTALPRLVSGLGIQTTIYSLKKPLPNGMGPMVGIVITTVVIYDNFLQRVREIWRVNYDSYNNTDSFTMDNIVYQAP